MESFFANDYGYNLMIQQRTPLPSIGTLLEVMRRQQARSPPQCPKKQTTWDQFGISNNTMGHIQYLSSSICPFDRDDPVFTVDTIHHAASDTKQTEENVGCKKQHKYTNIKQNGVNPMSKKATQTQTKKKANKKAGEINPRNETGKKTKLSNKKSLKKTSSLKTQYTSIKSSGKIKSANNHIALAKKEKNNANHSKQLSLKKTSGNVKAKKSFLNTKKSESLPELFSTLKTLLQYNNKVPKSNIISRYEVLDLSADFIKTLERKRVKIRGELKASTSHEYHSSSTKKKSTKNPADEATRRPSTKKTKVKKKFMSDKEQESKNDKNRNRPAIKIDKDEPSAGNHKTKSRQLQKAPIMSANEETSRVIASGKNFSGVKEKKSLKAPKTVKDGGRKAKKDQKAKKRLEKKAFLLYSKYWRPRLKKTFPDKARVEITDLLKSRWNVACRETKHRYEKIWQKQFQAKNSSKVFIEGKADGSKPYKKETSTKVSEKVGDRKRKNRKVGENSEVTERKRKKKNEEKRVLNIVNWVQCNHCKIWRILPENINVDTLPRVWFCQMNTDTTHNVCFIHEESYCKEQLKTREDKKRKT